jgi:hypothetical protein
VIVRLRNEQVPDRVVNLVQRAANLVDLDVILLQLMLGGKQPTS